MRLIYRGDPNELAKGGGLSNTSIGPIEGVTFVMGVPTDASPLSERTRAKLAKNNHFEVVADEEAAPATPVEETAAPVLSAEAKPKAARAAGKA